jgi:hypothetical protein
LILQYEKKIIANREWPMKVSWQTAMSCRGGRMIDDLIKQMLVGNENDQYNGIECRLVLQELLRRSMEQEPMIREAKKGVVIRLKATA